MARNVLWGLSGSIFPVLVALWAFPRLIEGLGNERFGLLGIIWMGVGYFSVFDLGLGAALTKLVAERLGKQRFEDIPDLIATGQRLMGYLGIVAAIVILLTAPWLVGSVIKIPDAMQQEALWSFCILAVTVPFVVVSAGYTGVLQAYQKSAWITMVRTPLGVLNFVGPVLMLKISSSLEWTTAFIAISRVCAFWSFKHLAARLYPRGRVRLNAAHLRELFSFGGWITVSNVVGPILVYFDRIMIGSLLGLTAVAFYTTPFELVVRLWIIPDAVLGVLFPALTVAFLANLEQARRMFVVASDVLLLAIAAPVGLIMLFAQEGLSLWLGADFARESAPIMQWLAIGVFVNSVLRVPTIAFNSIGRPDILAKLILLELPFYLLLLYFMLKAYGAQGAAMAWSLRLCLQLFSISFISCCLVPALKREQILTAFKLIATAVLMAALCLPESLLVKLGLAVGGLAVLALLSWRMVLRLGLLPIRRDQESI